MQVSASKSQLHPDSKVHVDNMGPTWVLSAPGGPTLAPWTLRSGHVLLKPHEAMLPIPQWVNNTGLWWLVWWELGGSIEEMVDWQVKPDDGFPLLECQSKEIISLLSNDYRPISISNKMSSLKRSQISCPKIWFWNYLISLIFDRCLGSIAAEASLELESDVLIKLLICWLQVFTRCYDKTFYQILKLAPGDHKCHTIFGIMVWLPWWCWIMTSILVHQNHTKTDENKFVVLLIRVLGSQCYEYGGQP